MKRKITGFDKDDENHWRAILECGHPQHVRHDPPLSSRPWVLTEEVAPRVSGSSSTASAAMRKAQLNERRRNQTERATPRRGEFVSRLLRAGDGHGNHLHRRVLAGNADRRVGATGY